MILGTKKEKGKMVKYLFEMVAYSKIWPKSLQLRVRQSDINWVGGHGLWWFRPFRRVEKRRQTQRECLNHHRANAVKMRLVRIVILEIF